MTVIKNKLYTIMLGLLVGSATAIIFECFLKNNFCLSHMLPTGSTSPCPKQKMKALGGLWTCG